jgi:predicted ribosomally synthesized peptide with SipW-like signal peptide
MKRILLSLVMLGVTSLLAISATSSYFSDTEEVKGNTITAGTLDLTVQNPEGVTDHISLGNVYPGWNKIYYWTIKNNGNMPGVVKVKIDNLVEKENGVVNNAEQRGEDLAIDPAGVLAGMKVGQEGGELGYLMKAVPSQSELYPSIEKSPSIPIANSYMPNGGGLHYLSTYGFFNLGRSISEATLQPGGSMQLKLNLGLEENLRIWDGTKWIDIDDNVIQSDSVEFDIVFLLEQVH